MPPMPPKRKTDQTLKGWLLDAYPSAQGMAVWIITEEGDRLRLTDDFHPAFYLDGPAPALRAALGLLAREPSPVAVKRVERADLFRGTSIPVVQATFQNPARFPAAVGRIMRLDAPPDLYNADIGLPQLYFYERGLFPLAFCEAVCGESGQIREIRALDSPWDLDLRPPPLRWIRLGLEGNAANPNHAWTDPARRGRIELDDGSDVRLLGTDDPLELPALLNRHIEKHDPDLILSDWGDSFIFPRLRMLEQASGIPLALNREPGAAVARKQGRSYASYGRMVYTAGARTLLGRWHIDRQNSFILHEAGLEGLLEQARVTKLPVQQTARATTGTGITSMQLETAYRDGILIPWRKRVPEAFKSGLDLLTIDKGGLVFLPPAGFYEDTAELDFASMYPAIMAGFNVSPETVGCRCCPGNRAPETGYTICTRRRGLVPRTLEPLLAKRAACKRRRDIAADPAERKRYDQRQNALKWLLVVSFGYLGYKNARFGRIEAHECVTAYSREKLLQAKEIAEDRGFRLLHAIVDSIWVKREGATEADYRELAAAISKGTDLPIQLEGIYRWIAFPPSRSRPTLAAPNRFLGRFSGGTLKIRGLEVRRSDSPPFIQTAQARMIEILAAARNRTDYEARIPSLLEILSQCRAELEEGRVPLDQLVITTRLSKEPQDYQKASLSAAAAQELAARGVKLSAGETIQYVITAASDRDPASRARAWAVMTADHAYDAEKYTELLLKAGEALLALFGYDLPRLRAETQGKTGSGDDSETCGGTEGLLY